MLDKIVKERQLGSWSDGNPSIGHGGLSEILAQLNANAPPDLPKKDEKKGDEKKNDKK